MTAIHLQTAINLLDCMRAQHDGASILIGTEQEACRTMALRLLRDVAETLQPEAVKACCLLADTLRGPDADRYIACAAVLGDAENLSYVNSTDCLPSIRAEFERQSEEFNVDRD